MKLEWFLGETGPKEKVNLRGMLLANRDSLDHLKKVLAKKVKETSTTSDYDNPSWAYWQADRNGYNRGIKEVISLLESIEEE